MQSSPSDEIVDIGGKFRGVYDLKGRKARSRSTDYTDYTDYELKSDGERFGSLNTQRGPNRSTPLLIFNLCNLRNRWISVAVVTNDAARYFDSYQSIMNDCG